jgi:hypothetical protein
MYKSYHILSNLGIITVLKYSLHQSEYLEIIQQHTEANNVLCDIIRPAK